MERLRRRREFLAVGRGRRISRPGFVLQALQVAEAGRPPRFGFTVTKKIGNAVVRNRIRRRLREVVRLSAPDAVAASTDYVLIGRRAALRLPFDRLVDDLRSGMAALSQNEVAGDRSGS
ncbi:MAG: ribonuclease P protein component [Bauldia sp.]|uniref:ribonuclease P protein component n=1 Tax=Bauldia sp. TaxID=2575872 RepID=UPI001DEE3C63|nr:ribonuclease P protein component [Bauldia sp.]MCB1496653.1 ribonuclease P protein component [Bauldia sp.]